ncbi:type II toxin-antitoxin system RelE/ParE family toxin [Bifidobacterium sp.]|uniref:type II toxin-antitoxin system RelE/ParE family toxin n=1 Tax=Bifidobacterium sp. TaxID=41200 RepID=UPI0039EC212E
MLRCSISISDAATSDIEDLVEFYLDLVDVDSARRFTDDLYETLYRLDVFPEGNAYFDEEHNLRRTHLRNHNVSIVFIVDDGIYQVVAIGAYHSLSHSNEYTRKIIDRIRSL